MIELRLGFTGFIGFRGQRPWSAIPPSLNGGFSGVEVKSAGKKHQGFRMA